MNIRHVFAIDSHAGGEAARIVVGPLLWKRCETMTEKKEYFERNYAALRRALIFEPKGHDNMFGAILSEPCDSRADIGLFFIESNECLNMCGHGTIATVTALIELGIIDTRGLCEKSVTLDTPAGLVTALAKIEGEKVVSVSFRNVPSFVFKRDCRVEAPGYGEITFDVSYGGNVFAQVPIASLGMKVELANAKTLARLGVELRKIMNAQISIQHPEKPINYIDHVTFYEYDAKQKYLKHCVTMGLEQIDRSPCGTGTSAFLALLAEKGELSAGDEIISESILGTKFTGKIVETMDFHGYRAITPEITGTGYVLGTQQFFIDERDPFVEGFSLNV